MFSKVTPFGSGRGQLSWMTEKSHHRVKNFSLKYFEKQWRGQWNSVAVFCGQRGLSFLPRPHLAPRRGYRSPPTLDLDRALRRHSKSLGLYAAQLSLWVVTLNFQCPLYHQNATCVARYSCRVSASNLQPFLEVCCKFLRFTFKGITWCRVVLMNMNYPLQIPWPHSEILAQMSGVGPFICIMIKHITFERHPLRPSV